jgi:hypothetical protein
MNAGRECAAFLLSGKFQLASNFIRLLQVFVSAAKSSVQRAVHALHYAIDTEIIASESPVLSTRNLVERSETWVQLHSEETDSPNLIQVSRVQFPSVETSVIRIAALRASRALQVCLFT